MTEGKICTKCKEYKLLCEYYKANNRKMGVKSACKECEKPTKMKHYRENKEKYKKAYNEFLLRNPDYRNEYYLKNNKKNISN